MMQQYSENSDNEKKSKIFNFFFIFKIVTFTFTFISSILRKALQNFLNYPPKQLKGTYVSFPPPLRGLTCTDKYNRCNTELPIRA